MFKTSLLFITIFSSINMLSNRTHDFHLSNCNLKYKASAEVLQLSAKIFIDDLESALAENGIENLYIGTEKESDESAIHIEEYLKQVFQIKSGDSLLSSQFIGKELSEDLAAVWCYVQYSEVTDCTDLQITNSILTELFDDQKNIFSFSTEEGRKDYFTFDSQDKVKTFSCE